MSEIPPAAQPFSEWLSDRLQDVIKVVIGSNRKPPRRLRSFLNGTWFGHLLHPVMTDVPIVAWLVTAIFDIIWLIAPSHNSWAALGAFVAVIVGLLGALGAIATGLTDWSDTLVPNAALASITRCSTRVRRFSTSSPSSSDCWPVKEMV